MGKKGYRLYNLTMSKVFVSIDVLFHEHISPYSSYKPSPNFSFTPVSPSFFDDDIHLASQSIPTIPITSTLTRPDPDIL